MALQNFIFKNSYSEIDSLSFQKINGDFFIQFSLTVYTDKTKTKIFNTLPFVLEKTKIEDDLRIHVYDKKIPEFDTSINRLDLSKEEQIKYDNKKTEFNKKTELYEKELAKINKKNDKEVEKNSPFNTIFTKEKIYETSNITACCYEYLKSLNEIKTKDC